MATSELQPCDSNAGRRARQDPVCRDYAAADVREQEGEEAMADEHGTYQGTIQYIEIPAADLDRDPAFYETVFGWKVQRDDTAYVMWQDPSGNFGGGMYTSIKPAAEGGPRIYITVDDIDATLPTIEKAGGALTSPKTLIDEHVGWWAGFTDPAGNAMYLYQSSHKHPH